MTNGNITNDPLFKNSAAGNYRLGILSPCRNTGINLGWHAAALDLDGLSRKVGTVDMGAYEAPLPPGVVIVIQ